MHLTLLKLIKIYSFIMFWFKLFGVYLMNKDLAKLAILPQISKIPDFR